MLHSWGGKFFKDLPDINLAILKSNSNHPVSSYGLIFRNTLWNINWVSHMSVPTNIFIWKKNYMEMNRTEMVTEKNKRRRQNELTTIRNTNCMQIDESCKWFFCGNFHANPILLWKLLCSARKKKLCGNRENLLYSKVRELYFVFSLTFFFVAFFSGILTLPYSLKCVIIIILITFYWKRE